MLLKRLAKGLLGRLLGYGAFGLGFWLLFEGFLRPNIALAVLGGGMILGGMYLMAVARRISPSPTADDPAKDWDASLDGSDESDKLPP